MLSEHSFGKYLFKKIKGSHTGLPFYDSLNHYNH